MPLTFDRLFKATGITSQITEPTPGSKTSIVDTQIISSKVKEENSKWQRDLQSGNLRINTHDFADL